MRGGENVVILDNLGALFCVFLLAQEGEPLLSCIHGYDHKQTKHHHKEESNHWS